MTKLTYAASGVNIAEENIAIQALAREITYRRRGTGEPLSDIGHYAGLIEFGEYVLALTTDGVGSKILVADALEKWDTIGIDCIAMNANDLLAMGVEPVAFTDYIAIDHPSPEKMRQIGIGLQRGAELSNLSIVGGETATLPDIVKGFDLAGTCLGIAEKHQIVTGEHIQIGDVLIGLPSSGLHSNGYTLVRKILSESDYSYDDLLPNNPRKTIGEELLEPTRIYLEILDLIKKVEVHGLAHITGSGLLKLRRLTEYGFNFTNPLPPQPIFRFLQREGDIDIEEMYKTFNMGMGFLVVLPEEEAKKALEVVGGQIVGEIVEYGITVRGIRID
jgi:phosphoribosylformylglycinamidine cyclo-ligase